MPDLRITDLASTLNIAPDDVFYIVQDGVSKQITAANLFSSIPDPGFTGNIFLVGDKQVLTQSNISINPIDVNVLRTEFTSNVSIELFPVLPSGAEGQLKVLSLIENINSGSVTLDVANSDIYGNTTLTFEKIGDTAFLLYNEGSWQVLGTSPGFKSSISGFTDNILEAPGTANLYYSNARARLAISAGDSTIVYNPITGEIRANLINLANLDLRNNTTDELPQGNANLYFSNTLAIAATEGARANLRAEIQKPTANVIYVKTNGDDNLDGRTEANALANIHVALARANAWSEVRVRSGEYTLWNNPVTVKERVALVGDNLRTTTVRPQNLTDDMFYVENASYVWGFTFRDHQSPAAVFAFNPDGSAGNIVTSPYIQNCSSITTTGTGMRVDGAVVGGLRSMVLDSYTQTNEGGIGVHMLNRGYTQLVSLFTICCHIAVWCQDGGFCSITNSNASFGNFGLVSDGVSLPLYYGKVAQVINSRTILMSNLTQRPNVGDAVLFANYDQTKCSRDTGLIVDSIAIDLGYQGNTQSTFAGLQYWAQSSSSIPGQATQTVAAINYVKQLAANVIASVSVGPKYQNTYNQVFANTASGNSAYTANVVSSEFNLIVDIISNGTVGITDRIVPNKYPANSNVIVQNAANLLLNNKTFLAFEAVAFVNNNYPTFSYNTNTCARDVGYIVDSIVFDLRHDGNRQAVQSGVYYYNFSTSDTQIDNQVVQTGAAYEFIKTLVTPILTANANVSTLQTVATINTTAAPALTTAEAANIKLSIDENLDLIVDIITNGPSAAPPKRPVPLFPFTASNAANAVRLLLANKDFVRAEVLEYTNQNWSNISNGTVQFYTVNASTPLVANGALGNTSVLTLDEKIPLVLQPRANSRTSFHQPSYISASGHTFEYVGSGNVLVNALPYAGGIPVQENEVVQARGGAVYYTSTDHKGDFRIGEDLLINRASGTIVGRTFDKSLFAVLTPYILAITPD